MNDQSHTSFLANVEGRVPLTMSSLEIAGLTGKQHDNVMRDIRNMLKTLDVGGLLKTEDTPVALKFDGTYRNAQNGETYPCFHLPKRECLILVSGYDVVMRAKIIDRWMLLEESLSKPALPDLSDPAVLVQLLTVHASKRIEAERRADIAEKQVEAAKPKTDFYDRFVDADGVFGLRNAGRILSQGPNKFIESLKRKYLFYEGSSLVPYVQYKHSGLFTTKPYIDAEGKTHHQTFMTPKGIQYFAKKLGVQVVSERDVPEPALALQSPSNRGGKNG